MSQTNAQRSCQLLALDLGNTRIHWLQLTNDSAGAQKTLTGAAPFDGEVWPTELAGLLAQGSKSVILATVRPELTASIRQRVLAGGHHFALLGEDFFPSIRNQTRRPEQVGLDRLMLGEYAHSRYPGHECLCLGLGTALTANRVTPTGEFIGGSISPGLRIQFASLAQNASLLPEVSLTRSPERLGSTTVEAIASGIYWSFVDTIHGIVNYYGRKHADLKVVLSGGDVNRVADDLSFEFEIQPNAVLLGLVHCFRQSMRERE